MQQQPFSYAAGIPNEANQGNPLHALGQSISFGRFMSESLAWEKWSTFSHNRYVEEAERFSRPGSVAQKKAYFEAHYKNLAARKAAALLEQATAAANNVSEAANEDEFQENATQDPGIAISSEASFVPDDNVPNSHAQIDKSESRKVEEVDPLRENQADLEDFAKIDSLSQDFISNKDDLGSKNKKKPAGCSSKSLISGRASKLPCTPVKPAASVRSRKENNATPISKKSALDSLDKKDQLQNQLTSQKHLFTPQHLGAKQVARSGISPKENKSQSPNLSTPFRLKTEERAARRKERLEEKFNANQAQQVQLQATLKVQLTHPQSPNLGRTPTPSMLKSTSQPPQRSSFKNSSSKHAMGKKSDNSRSLTSRLRSIASENTSPNIQHEQVAKK
ncbi:hypothetical protein GH714_041863 [Hevea brasiliensis]|uniref:TPX2 C-terminal domain-containing protein n=1 Tax=Hevea brasiliensis TaxID=3981 RepID=A0A6A6MRJ8_HEVBR|nr:hypothetical protein GH714_041863 [Hevea brasiliensis]